MHSNKITEQQNQNSIDIDQKSIPEILEIINNEDSTVHHAVKIVNPQIADFITDVVNCFKKNGRLFYIGAGTSGRLGVLDASECPPTYRTNPEMVQGIIAGGRDALIRSIEGAEDDDLAGKEIIQINNIGNFIFEAIFKVSNTTPSSMPPSPIAEMAIPFFLL